LEEETLTIYKSESGKNHEAEITMGGKSGKVFKLFAYVNHCTCDFYWTYCIKLMYPTDLFNTANSFSKSRALTCEHVLALELGKLLKSKNFREKTMHEKKYKVRSRKMVRTKRGRH